MKGLVLLAALAFGGLQSVTVIDCPCAALCGHKNRCEEAKESPDDCCRESRNGTLHEEACFHLEPQTDVDGPPSVDPPAPRISFAPCLPAIFPATESLDPIRPSESPPARDCPLYLRNSCLLI